MTSEAVIQRYILTELNQIPYSEWIKPTTTNKNGTQDILGQIRGYFIAIEVKTSDRKAVPSKLQRYRIEKTNRIGGLSFWTNNWKATLHNLELFAKEKGFSLYDRGCCGDGKRT